MHHASPEDCPSTENPESLQNRRCGNDHKTVMTMVISGPAITKATNDESVVALFRIEIQNCVKVNWQNAERSTQNAVIQLVRRTVQCSRRD